MTKNPEPCYRCWPEFNSTCAYCLTLPGNEHLIHEGPMIELLRIRAGGIKHDQGKLRYDLLPPEPIEELVKILTHGAAKYGPNNWQGLDHFEDRYYAACMRHLQLWRQGERLDKDSGLSHLAHAMCCITFLLWKEGK